MNQQDQKQRNRERVLSLLRSVPGISQVEIADRSRLQPSTTSNLIRTLKERGIVATMGKRDSGPQGGKKAEILGLRGEYGHFGGIYLKEDEIIFGVVDFGGCIISRKSISVSGENDDFLLSTIAAEVEANVRRYQTYRGTGIAVSSVVNLNGEITESLYFNRAIPRIISEIHLRVPELPVVVDNDANCAADWVLVNQAGGSRNLVHLQVQTSPVTIGAGIIIDGHLYRGTTGAAGELLQKGTASGNGELASTIEMTARFVASFLDTEGIFVAGELDAPTLSQLSASAEQFQAELKKELHVLDNPDLPVLGAALRAIRMHINQIQWERS
jgi:predicted NBD/HSP70 family sugar kinase